MSAGSGLQVGTSPVETQRGQVKGIQLLGALLRSNPGKKITHMKYLFFPLLSINKIW